MKHKNFRTIQLIFVVNYIKIENMYHIICESILGADVISVTRKKLPNVYKSCLKTILLQK